MTASETALNARFSKVELIELDEDFYEMEFRALGSACRLLFSASGRPEAETLRTNILRWLAGFEAKFSRYLPDSELSKVNQAAGKSWVEIDSQFELLLDICAHSHFVSEGAFDATSLPLSRLWDWQISHSSLPTEAEITGALALVGWSKVQRAAGKVFLPTPGMMLDFGGIGKEFAVDCAMQLAVGLGILEIMVDLGGDIAVSGVSPDEEGWYVGLEDPNAPGSTHCGIRLKSGAAVATSGDYRRCFEINGRSYGHILDCRTGWPAANGTRSATVITPRCTTSGILSTCAMVLGGREAIEMLNRTNSAEGCIWHKGSLYETRGFRSAIVPESNLSIP